MPSDSQELAFEDIVEVHAALGDKSQITLLEAVTLWRTLRRTRGEVLEIGRNNGFSTALAVAATLRRRVCSFGESKNVISPVADFLRLHRLTYHVELRVGAGLAPVDSQVGTLLLHCPPDLEESLTRLLLHWASLTSHENQCPVICLHLARSGQAEQDEAILADFTAALEELISEGAAEPIAKSGRLFVLRKLDDAPAGPYLRYGNLARERRRFDVADCLYQRIVDRDPSKSEAWHEYGRSLTTQGQYEIAEQHLRKALDLKRSHHTLNNLALCLMRTGKSSEAIPLLLECLDREPKYIHGLNTLGWAFEEEGRLDEAAEYLKRATEVDPEYTHAQYNLGRTLLIKGDLKNGWKQFEWRWKQPNFPTWKREYDVPLWEGQPLEGKSIILWSEQGIGDQIVFSSMIPDVVRMGATGVIECSGKLVPLFARSFPEFTVVEKTETPNDLILKGHFDFHAPHGNLGRYLRDDLSKFPNRAGYIRSDPNRVKFWKQRLDSLGSKVKVGIAWRSKNKQGGRAKQYLGIEDLGPILHTPNCTFVCVQYGAVGAEIELARQLYGVDIVRFEDLDLFDDLDSVLAMTQSLQLGVAPKSSSCLDVMAVNDVEVLTFDGGPTDRNLGTEHVPWFPRAMCFRCEPDESVPSVVQRMAATLKAKAEELFST